MDSLPGLAAVKNLLADGAAKVRSLEAAVAQAASAALDSHSVVGHAVSVFYDEARFAVLGYVGATFGSGARRIASVILPTSRQVESDDLETSFTALAQQFKELSDRVSYLEERLGYAAPPPSRLKAALAAVAQGFLDRAADAVTDSLREGVGWQ